MVDENTRRTETPEVAGTEPEATESRKRAGAKGGPNLLGPFGKPKADAKERTINHVRVSDGALASIIGLSAHEVPGVVGMAPASMSEGLRRLLGARQVDEGVVIEHPNGEERADVDLHVVVAYGVNIPVVADSVRERVRYAALHYAGITLDVIKVRVVGVSRG